MKKRSKKVQKGISFMPVYDILARNKRTFEALVRKLCKGNDFSVLNFGGGLYGNKHRSNDSTFFYFAEICQASDKWNQLTVCFDATQASGITFLTQVCFASTSCLCPCGNYFFSHPRKVTEEDLIKMRKLIYELIFIKTANLESIKKLEKEKKKPKRFKFLMESYGIRMYSKLNPRSVLMGPAFWG